MIDKNFYKRNEIILEMVKINDKIQELVNSMLDSLGDSEEVDKIAGRIELFQGKYRELNSLCDSLKP